MDWPYLVVPWCYRVFVFTEFFFATAAGRGGGLAALHQLRQRRGQVRDGPRPRLLPVVAQQFLHQRPHLRQRLL